MVGVSLDEAELLTLIETGEGTAIEWKRELNASSEQSKREFAKDLCGMANTGSERGHIIYGVTDEGKTVGIHRDPGIDESLIQIASSRIEPPVDFEPVWVPLKNSLILVLIIPKSRKRPHSIIATRDVFIRRNKVVEKAHPKEIIEMSADSNWEVNPRDVVANETRFTTDLFDPSFFMLGGLEVHYRTVKKLGPFSNRSSPTVFDPLLTIFVPTPEFGNTKSAISFESGFYSHTVPRDDFMAFLKNFEQSISSVASSARIWDRQLPLFWSISSDDGMDYGVGAESASLAMQETKNGVLACAMHFSRFNIYRPTCLLVFYAEYSPGQTNALLCLDNCWMKMLTSSLPLNPKWVQRIFNVLRGISSSFKAEIAISDALIENVSTTEWETTGQIKIRPRIHGFMGRERSGVDPMFDRPLGLVVDMVPFRNSVWERDDERTWNFDYCARTYTESPAHFFEELPVRVTNPVTAWLDIQKGYGTFGRLRIKQIVVQGFDSAINILAGHSALVEFE